MKRVVFISHSSADRAIAEEVCLFLETNGIVCWIAPRDVTPGKNYGAAILDAIDECSVFVLILSAESNKSGQVEREVERAASSNSVLIPVRVEDVKPSRNLEFYVSSAHWLDAISKPFDKHLRELLKAIQNWQAGDTTKFEPAAPPPPKPTPLPSPPARHFPVSPLVATAILAALLLCGLVAYKVLRHKSTTSATSPQTVAASASSPAQSASPLPTATTALSPEPGITSTTPSETSPSPTMTAERSPSPFFRRRPGEPLRSPALSEAVPSPAPTATMSPVRMRPGQPISPAVAPSPAPQASAQSPGAKGKSSDVVAQNIREVVASSELKAETRNHRPGLAFDGNQSTSWMPKPGATNQSITVHFKSPTAISSVSILSGFAENQEAYLRNNRVRRLRLTFGDGSTQVVTFEDKMEMQRFELKQAATTEWITFEILTVFHGSKTKLTPISEILFNREP
jgi:hypothetical protein